METGKMFQMKMRVTKIKGGTGKPDESRENKEAYDEDDPSV